VDVVEVLLALLEEDADRLPLGLPDRAGIPDAAADVGEAADAGDDLAERVGPEPGDR
jgi:hypothetical protein